MRAKSLLLMASINFAVALMIFVSNMSMGTLDFSAELAILINIGSGFFCIYNFRKINQISLRQWNIDTTGYKITQLGKAVLSNKKLLHETMKEKLTEEEIKDWHKMEDIHPDVGLTTYEEKRLLKYAEKAGFLKKQEEKP